MSVSSRNTDDARAAFQTCKSSDPKDRVKFYDSWAENYETDHNLMNYKSPQLAVDFLSEHFSGNPEEALVLDVACGSGWVAKLMAELGFKHFEGVDGSQGMLDLAAKTGLYKDLRLALLGPEPLPAQPGVFDVVIIVGGLDAGFAPVSVVRELCNAAKSGGFICMSRGDHSGTPAEDYKAELDRELRLMEEEGLWTPVGTKRTDRYMEDPHVDPKGLKEGPTKGLKEGPKPELFISGTVYLFKKSKQ